MNLFQILEADPMISMIAAGMLGLMIGSFLNVVIYRLPIMMERAWRRESSEYLQIAVEPTGDRESFNLIRPASRCPKCASPVRPWQNIPVISYLILGGKCANCRTTISVRYPIIEALTAVLSALVVGHFGFSVQAGTGLILTWALICLSVIDIDHQLLPDSITLPSLWLGLALSIQKVFTDSHSAILGAIFGYLSLWLVYKLFKILTGKEGMGFGDFKLLAMLGAWMGWQYLPLIILFSSFGGACVGILLILSGKQSRSMPIPFGPYLSAAGWTVLLWGEQFLNWYLEMIA